MKKHMILLALAASVQTVVAGGGDPSAAAVRLMPKLAGSVAEHLQARSQLIGLQESAIPELVHSMASRDELVRSQCADILASMGPKALPALKESLTSPEWRVRASACLALGSMKPSAQRNRILAFAVKDSDWWVRSLAVLNLKGARDHGSLVAIRTAMKDPDERVRQRASDAYLSGAETASSAGR